MGEQTQKRLAHEVIMDNLDITLHQMNSARSADIERQKESSIALKASMDLIRTESRFVALLDILGEMVIPDVARPWIAKKLAEFVDRMPVGLLPYIKSRQTLRRI